MLVLILICQWLGGTYCLLLIRKMMLFGTCNFSCHYFHDIGKVWSFSLILINQQTWSISIYYIVFVTLFSMAAPRKESWYQIDVEWKSELILVTHLFKITNFILFCFSMWICLNLILRALGSYILSCWMREILRIEIGF